MKKPVINKKKRKILNDLSKRNVSQKHRIAVLSFNAYNASVFAAKSVSEIIATEISKKQVLTVIECSQMKVIFD